MAVMFGLYGAGGFAREVMPFARDVVRNHEGLKAVTASGIRFIETEPVRESVNGIPLVSEADFLASPERKFFNVAIADSGIREAVATRCIRSGAVPISLIAPNATLYDANEIGEGAILCAYVTVTSNVRIGRFFHANIYSYVGHDCVIGDFVTFGPSVHCNGNVHIGSRAYIGTGAVIRHGVPGKPLMIGEGAVVGMGAVVTKDVAPHTMVVGNPARVMDKKAS